MTRRDQGVKRSKGGRAPRRQIVTYQLPDNAPPDVKAGSGDDEQEMKHDTLIAQVTDGVDGTSNSEDPNETKGESSGIDEMTYPLK
ncbi:hypothetical protein FRC10_008416 [Ceratobasidium sp. 414]|nr:hypothetical protein FRC10_008416 [Ceratobasidium sp. 414]